MLGFGIALVMLATIAVITYRSTHGFLNTAQLVARSRHVLEVQESLRRNLIEAENNVRGYLLAADEQYLPAYDRAQQGLIDDFNALKILTHDRTEQQRQLDALRPLLAKKSAILKSAMTTRHTTGIEAAAMILGDGEDQRVSTEMRELLEAFVNEEQQLLVQREQFTRDIGRSTTAIIIVGTVLSFIILGTAVVFILRDIAARRRAEEALAEEHNLLRSVIDAMPEHVFVKDVQGRYVLDNVAHRQFIGANRLREIEGKKSDDFLPLDLAQQFMTDDEKVLRNGTRVLNREEQIIDRHGNICWLSTTKVPLRDVDGNCIGLVGVSSDISIRKRAEERLRLTAEQLRRSNYELEQFASVASHDLQEPLRKIQAFGDRLQRKCGEAVGEEGRDYLGRMQDAARRMQTLLHDLLTLSRVTSQARPFEQVNLGGIVHEVVGDLEVRIEQSSAKIEVGNLPTIDADPAQMRQLFQNLISNAMKFQRHGSAPEVFISAKIREMTEEQLPGASAGDEICQIMVQDNGIGFDEKYLDRIFTVFQRLHSRSEYEGTGIGLAVCRKILDRHGGIISAKSAEGQGATFIVTLPVKQRMKNADETSRGTNHDSNG